MADAALRAYMLELGAPAELVDHLDDGALIGLAGDFRLGAGLDMTLDGVAEASGVDIESARSVYTALGLDIDELAGFGPRDIELLEMVAGDTRGLVDELSGPVLRVAGAALRRLAEALVAAYVQDIEKVLDERGASAVELAELNGFASDLVVRFGDALGTMFRHHMWVAVRRQRLGQAEVAGPELIRMGIGFVDLVGFTPISRELAPAALSALIEEFEQRAFDVAGTHHGRIVKSIGDEVMVAANGFDEVAQIALGLADAFQDHAAIRPRAGISAGDVLFRLGDYYGPVVNLASRLAAVADGGQVLTDRKPPATSAFAGVDHGLVTLKGFPEAVRVYALERRLAGPSPADDPSARST